MGELVIKARFMEKIKVDEQSQCWNWIGAKGGNGKYGMFSYMGKFHLAHRVSWMLFKGKIQEGLYICHICDNSLCVNPDHIYVGTAKDNGEDRANRGRAGGIKDEMLIELIGDCNSGSTVKQISNAYDMSSSYVGLLVSWYKKFKRLKII